MSLRGVRRGSSHRTTYPKTHRNIGASPPHATSPHVRPPRGADSQTQTDMQVHGQLVQRWVHRAAGRQQVCSAVYVEEGRQADGQAALKYIMCKINTYSFFTDDVILTSS